jgi:hypothetical protein
MYKFVADLRTSTALRYSLPKMNKPYPLNIAQRALKFDGRNWVQSFINIFKQSNTDKTSFWHNEANSWFITHPTKLLLEGEIKLLIFSDWAKA